MIGRKKPGDLKCDWSKMSRSMNNEGEYVKRDDDSGKEIISKCIEEKNIQSVLKKTIRNVENRAKRELLTHLR